MARPKRDGLTPQQRRFVIEYCVDRNGRRAAMRAGYSERTATSQASRLLTNVNVWTAIQKELDKIFDRTQSKARDVIMNAQCIADLDPADMCNDAGEMLPLLDMPPHVRKAISSIKRGQFGREIRFWDKNAAQTNLFKYHKLLVERREITITTGLAARMAAARKRMQKKRGSSKP